MKTLFTEKDFEVSSGRVYLSIKSGSGQRGFHGVEVGNDIYDPETDFKDFDLGSGSALKSGEVLVEILSTVAMMNPSSNRATITYTLEDDDNTEEWVAEIADIAGSHAIFLCDINFV